MHEKKQFERNQENGFWKTAVKTRVKNGVKNGVKKGVKNVVKRE